MCGTHFFRACVPLCYVAKVYSSPYRDTRERDIRTHIRVRETEILTLCCRYRSLFFECCIHISHNTGEQRNRDVQHTHMVFI